MFQSRFQDSFQIKKEFAGLVKVNSKFQSRFQDSFQIKSWTSFNLLKSFNPVSRIRFKSSTAVNLTSNLLQVSIPFPGFVSNQVKFGFDSKFAPQVSIPFPGFVSNQVVSKIKVFGEPSWFQSRFQDSFQIKPLETSPLVGDTQFQSRFQDSFQIKFASCNYCERSTISVSIPFPGFVSNQVFR